MAALCDELGWPIRAGWSPGTVDSWDVRSARVIAVVHSEEGHVIAIGVDLQNEANQRLNQRSMGEKCKRDLDNRYIPRLTSHASIPGRNCTFRGGAVVRNLKP